MNHILTQFSIALIILTNCSCSNESSYRRNKDGKSLYAVLYKYVSNGDTLEEVEKYLGPGKEISFQKNSPFFTGLQKLAIDKPDQFPDGISQSDMIIGYSIEKEQQIVLMFRDGKLVNYVQNKFVEFPTQ